MPTYRNILSDYAASLTIRQRRLGAAGCCGNGSGRPLLAFAGRTGGMRVDARRVPPAPRTGRRIAIQEG